MAIKISKILFLSILFFSCGYDKKEPPTSEEKTSITNKEEPPISDSKKHDKQLNISILWDLSDRINPQIHTETPTNAEKDIEILKYFTNYFKEDMKKKGAYLSKGKLKVFCSPYPDDNNIMNLLKKLNVELVNKDSKEKKKIYDSITNTFEQTGKQIADLTIKSSKWDGSDIHRFFKNDVVNYCVNKDTNYRNILVILTDGYLYHKYSKDMIENKSEFILPSLLSKLGLRKNHNFKTVFDTKNCGLIATRNDLNNLEILVLEVNSEENYKDDEDVIKLYLEKWFDEMKTKRHKIYNTDLPDNTKNKISDFLNN